MKDLKDYANTNVESFTQEVKEKIDGNFSEEKLQQAKIDYGGLVQEFLSRYGNMGEGQLMQEMMKIIKQKKADGTYNPDEIRAAAKQIAPILSPEQRTKMERLLNFL